MESDVITLQEIFEFKVDSFAPDGTIIGRLRPTGLRPTFLRQVREARHRASRGALLALARVPTNVADLRR